MAESLRESRAAGHAPPPREPALRELRDLLFGPEIERIDEVRQEFFDPSLHARQVSRVLPEAVTLRASEDREMVDALQGTVEEIIRTSVKRKPEMLIDVLYPIMGSAIRRSIAAAFRDMLRSISRALDASFSPRSLKWRLEAFRTGKSFAEVVLLHTMYRVEQIFMIHRSNGLLLDHVVAPEAASQDPDLVSAMLTAIRDFVKDSFAGASSDVELDTLELGDLTIWVEQGPQAILAAVIRGSAPSDFRHRLQETLERFHLAHADDLPNFNGDSSVFASSRPELEACLETRFEDGATSAGISPLLWVAPALLLVLLAGWLVLSWRESRRWAQFLDGLDGRPGIVIAKAEKRDGRYRLSGLRDPLAADPKTLFQEAGYDPALLDEKWEPFIALDPQLVVRRAETLLKPPKGVSLRLEEGVLHAAGQAPPEWIEATERAASSIPGVDSLDASALRLPYAEQIRDALAGVAQTRIYFDTGSTEIAAAEAEKAAGLAGKIRALVELAKLAGGKVRLVVLGHVDNSGPPALNESLKLGRARTTARLLAENGVAESQWLEIATVAADSDLLERSVSFEAVYRETP